MRSRPLALALAAVLATTLLAPPAAARPAAHGATGFAQPVGRPDLPLTLDTPNFRVHYDTAAGSPHQTEESWAQAAAAALEASYASQVVEQGWARPADDAPRGGDGRIDAYIVELVDVAEGQAPADDDHHCPDPQRCAGQPAYMLLDDDLDDDPEYEPTEQERLDALHALVAHEFAHVVQWAEAALAAPWMIEMTAMWQEQQTFPDINRRTTQVEDMAARPEQPLTASAPDGGATAAAYGYWPFLAHLAERHGRDVVRDAWRATLDRGQEGLGGFSAALEARGSTFAREFAGFAALTAAWPAVQQPADRLDGEPVSWPEVARTEVAPSLPHTTDGPLDATSYRVIDVPVADRVAASMTTSAPQAQAWVAVVAVRDGDAEIDLRPTVGGRTTAVLEGIGDADRVSVVVINADPTAAPRTDPYEPPTYVHDGLDVDVTIAEDLPAVIDADLDHDARIGVDGAVEQAIATSQALFADGTADRVVLATAERFPDALAGAGLAGDRGPILLVPPGPVLDPRVSAEIRRATGAEDGDGAPVLVLGGTAAVAEEVAHQARAAGGAVPCTAPLPGSCRFDGATREETAVRIAEVVLAESPGEQVLIARADDPADAITGGAYAAWAGVPLVLTPPTSPGGPAAAFLDANPQLADVVVLGGEAAVDAATAQALGATRRVAGAERTATTAAIATDLWGLPAAEEATALLVNVRAADGWPAALAASVASAVHSAPQLGVDDPPAGIGAEVAALLAEVDPVLLVFGSDRLVSEDQRTEALAARG